MRIPFPSRRTLLRRLTEADAGSSAAEFGLVLPLLLLFVFGIIDGGRLMWTWNQAEKATQMGARMAVVTTMVPGGLYTDFSPILGQGVVVPTSTFGKALCSKPAAAVSCTCEQGSNCPTLTPVNTTAFDDVVTRMKYFLPSLQAANVEIEYENAGLGYAGDPNGPDVVPLVTVQLTGVTFRPLIFTVFGGSITLPAFSTSLTLEDGAGSKSN